MKKIRLKFFRRIFESRWFIFFATGFFIFALLFSSIFFAFDIYYKNKIFPGVRIGNTSLSGKLFDTALEEIEKSSDQLMSEGLFFKYKDREVVISSLLIAPEDPGLSREIFAFDIERSVMEAYQVGREGGLLTNIKNRLIALLNDKNIDIYYQLNEKELKDILANNFSSLENPGRNAGIDIKIKNDQFKINVLPEKLGQSFDYDLAIVEARNNLNNLSVDPIEMYMKTDYPEIKELDVQNALFLVEKLLSIFPVSLAYSCLVEDDLSHFCPEDESKLISKENFADWIVLKVEKGGVEVNFNQEKIEEFLGKEARNVDVLSQDAKLKIKDNKVLEFQESKDGLKLNIKKTLAEINNKFLLKNTSTAEIIIEKDKAKNEVGDINDLGIEELIGVGKSDFSGSPQNRRHNIKVGAEALDGLLIKTGEEFSLVEALGEINKETGYLPELVIKGNKTVPEYGGGLCQIATTSFRVALDAGLPIIERRPHAYRVSYYEPAGTDATIYIPKPDFRFLNDTEKYILIQTEIKGDELIFELWGTSDGRKVEISDTKIFNIVSPGPIKIVETEDLAPGEKKCTESSHNGADAEFTRKIVNALGEESEETWFSRYRPWRAVCLVGKEPSPEATSTEDMVD